MSVNSHAEVMEGVYSVDMTGNVGATGDTSKIPLNLHHSQLTMPDISIMRPVAVIGKKKKANTIPPEFNHSL